MRIRIEGCIPLMLGTLILIYIVHVATTPEGTPFIEVTYEEKQVGSGGPDSMDASEGEREGLSDSLSSRSGQPLTSDPAASAMPPFEEFMLMDANRARETATGLVVRYASAHDINRFAARLRELSPTYEGWSSLVMTPRPGYTPPVGVDLAAAWDEKAGGLWPLYCKLSYYQIAHRATQVEQIQADDGEGNMSAVVRSRWGPEWLSAKLLRVGDELEALARGEGE